jgi:hypothetical protein
MYVTRGTAVVELSFSKTLLLTLFLLLPGEWRTYKVRIAASVRLVQEMTDIFRVDLTPPDCVPPYCNARFHFG